MSDPGRLRYRLVLQEAVESADGAGGVARSYRDAATLWAALAPLSVRESLDAEALGATATHRITLRASVTVTNRHRFTLGPRIFRVVAVRDPDESGRFLDVLAQERID
jgi:SPP1 family predicted phage head-tail adaptor